jgi:autoinducer 2-degrading protein
VSHVAIVARVTVKEGKADEYLAAFAPLLEQAKKEPGTLLYAVHRSKHDPHLFWTTEVYAADDAFAAHSASEVHAAASPVFTELIAATGVLRPHRPAPTQPPRRPPAQPDPAHHRRHPDAQPPAHPGLHPAPPRRRQDRQGNPPLHQALPRPPSPPSPKPGLTNIGASLAVAVGIGTSLCHPLIEGAAGPAGVATSFVSRRSGVQGPRQGRRTVRHVALAHSRVGEL